MMDERPNQDDVTPDMEFEGRIVNQCEAILPRVTVDAAEAYKSGTILRLAVEVRVGNVRFEENGDDTLTRSHVLKYEHLEVVSAYNPAEEVLGGGGASSTPSQTPEGAEELGIEIQRSGGTWPSKVSALSRASEG